MIWSVKLGEDLAVVNFITCFLSHIVFLKCHTLRLTLSICDHFCSSFLTNNCPKLCLFTVQTLVTPVSDKICKRRRKEEKKEEKKKRKKKEEKKKRRKKTNLNISG